MLGRGVKEGGKLHNLFYPPVRTERMMKGGKGKGRVAKDKQRRERRD